jgi:hypothetical protein
MELEATGYHTSLRFCQLKFLILNSVQSKNSNSALKSLVNCHRIQLMLKTDAVALHAVEALGGEEV